MRTEEGFWFFPHLGAYSFNATGWEEARNWAPMDRYGNLYILSYLAHNNSGVLTRQTIFRMAPGDFMLRTMLNVSIPLIIAGVDVIQLDGCPSLPFLNYVNPALPKGGGAWWAENFTKVFNDVRERPSQYRIQSFHTQYVWRQGSNNPYTSLALSIPRIPYTILNHCHHIESMDCCRQQQAVLLKRTGNSSCLGRDPNGRHGSARRRTTLSIEHL